MRDRVGSPSFDSTLLGFHRKRLQENIGFCSMGIFLQEDGQNQRDDKFLVTEVRSLNFLERLFDQVDRRFVIANDRLVLASDISQRRVRLG
jgi:hypothetical protein